MAGIEVSGDVYQFPTADNTQPKNSQWHTMEGIYSHRSKVSWAEWTG